MEDTWQNYEDILNEHDDPWHYYPDHLNSIDCWCGPKLEYEYPDSGNQVWVHNEIQ